MLSSVTWQISQKPAWTEGLITLLPQIIIQHFLADAAQKYYRIGKAGFLVQGKYNLAQWWSILPFNKMNSRTLQNTNSVLESHFRPSQQKSWGWGMGAGYCFFFFSKRFKRITIRENQKSSWRNEAIALNILYILYILYIYYTFKYAYIKYTYKICKLYEITQYKRW